MPITLGRAQKHVRDQVARLNARRGRSIWPKYLYHACDVRTAVKIIRDGQLKSRNEASDFVDVANEGALNIYSGSHSCAKLYFRPKNNFHFRTEGIKCIADSYRLKNHMSIPVMFVFDFCSVITHPSARFSSGNVQRSKAFLDGNAAFDGIDFDAVYHDGPTNPDNRDYIQNMRMSEVSIDGNLDLDPHLRAVVFRTQSDMHTFEYLLSKDSIECKYRTFVERSRGTLFLARGFYLNELSLVSGTISLTFNYPSDYAPPDKRYKVFVQQSSGGKLYTYDKTVELVAPTFSIRNYSKESGVWRIVLEDQLAFRGPIKSEVSELF